MWDELSRLAAYVTQSNMLLPVQRAAPAGLADFPAELADFPAELATVAMGPAAGPEWPAPGAPNALPGPGT